MGRAEARQNLAKHRMDFADLTPEFFETAHIGKAKQNRFLAVGELKGVAVIAVVFRSQALSVISMRRASRSERSKPWPSGPAS